MAKISASDLSIRINDLSRKMQEHWEPEVFFSELLSMYGTANNSINMALKNEIGYNVASKAIDDSMARPDLAISLRAYFRFLKDDADVVPALERVKELKEVSGPKHKFQFLVCAGPTVLTMFDTVEHDSITIEYGDLPGFYSFMMPLLDGRKAKIVADKEADRKACLKLTRLLDTLAEHNHIADDNMQQLNSFMVRILFCFFAEDTGVFQLNEENAFSNAFNKLVDREGSNAKKFFEDIFTVLNTKETERDHLKNVIADELLHFPYVNGGLFAETGFIPDFDIVTRNQFTDCGHLTWSDISPAVFGAMFQGAMNKEERRSMGAHYTSEENILKLIKPLFLDDLYAEFEELKKKAEPLKLEAATAKRADTARRKNEQVRGMFYEFLERIGKLKFLDPACGCGNFLLIAYKELRILESKIFEYINEAAFTDSYININQFYGIEIEDWPVEIAHVSMWLMQHLMNQQANARFGSNISSIPLKTSATIVRANALTSDWNEVLPAEECSFILGNPPFSGFKYATEEQKECVRAVYPPKHKLGMIDLVSAWFVKASDYMMPNKSIHTAFVATNSICQGEQVNTLWGLLLDKGIHINFAYTSFPWTNDAVGKAGVTCIIIGFSYNQVESPKLIHFDSKTKEQSVEVCNQISPYLADCISPVIISRRQIAFRDDIDLFFGNKAVDNGTLLLSYQDGQKAIEDHPEIKPFLKKYIGSQEMMNSEFRYCLWLKEEDREQWSVIPEIMKHVDACAIWRESQVKSGDSYKLRNVPWSFRSQLNPNRALIIPVVSSARRKYLPMEFISSDSIGCAQVHMLPNASYYDFGVLSSLMHNVWTKFTAGRMKTDIRYSRDMVFNTFVWPEVSAEQHDEIEELAKDVLRFRVDHKFDMTLGEMYNPDTMPEDIKEAHAKLDAAVERAYREEPFKDDEERLAFLINLYSNAIAAQKEAEKNKPKAKSKK